MTSSKLKLALIGTGSWAQQHARILFLRPDVDFCAVVGHDEARTARCAAEYSTRPYTSVETMLREQRPDLVCICLPNQHHFGPTLQVIKAGYPLFYEKRLVFELAQADKLLEVAGARDLFSPSTSTTATPNPSGSLEKRSSRENWGISFLPPGGLAAKEAATTLTRT